MLGLFCQEIRGVVPGTRLTFLGVATPNCSTSAAAASTSHSSSSASPSPRGLLGSFLTLSGFCFDPDGARHKFSPINVTKLQPPASFCAAELLLSVISLLMLRLCGVVFTVQ